jgi:hypothetical protein
MIKKKFDCVEMKHQGAESIAEKISELSPADELEFWKISTQELIEAKNAIENKREKEGMKYPDSLS